MLQKAQKMTGMLRVCSATAPDGQQVLTVLPNGVQFCLPADVAMTYAFALLITAKELIPQDALDTAVPAAYDAADQMLVRTRKSLQ
jgi:hypothetical protein